MNHPQLYLSLMLVICFASTACRQGVPLEKGGEFSESEQASLAAIDPALVNWPIGASAIWSDGGVFRRIFLHGGIDIGGTVSGHDKMILVFDAAGKLLEANEFTFHTQSPSGILGVDPIKVRLGKSGFAPLSLTPQEGLRRLKEQGKQLRAGYGLLEIWKRLGRSRPAGDELWESHDVAQEWIESGETNIQNLEKRLRQRGLL